jgi:aldehyde:ferredoxin oxidoreductase
MDQTRDKRYLIIDLTKEEFEDKEIKPEIIENYPSGIALATYLLYSILPAGTNPLSADSVMVFASGMFAGMPYSGATRVGIAAKSPLTGLWAGGTMGGEFAWVLSRTEWDAVVIQGKARKLSYLLLDEGRVFFRGAQEMEGYSCSQCQETFKEKWGQGSATVCIGPAGESQVKFATLEDGSFEAPIRGGLGAIFGAKNLKALVVRPYTSIKDQKTGVFLEAVLPLIKDLKETESTSFLDMTTLDVLRKLDHEFALPTRNFQSANFEEEWFNTLEGLDIQKRSCTGCPVACLEVFVPEMDSQSQENTTKTPLHPEPLWALGPLLNLLALDETLAALKACGDCGMDPTSFGILAAWMAECHERKIPLAVASDPVPEFGNGSWLPDLSAKITHDHEIRELLGQGVFEAAKKTGPVSQAFAMHFCGQELSFVDPRRDFWPLSFLGASVWMPFEDNGLASELRLEKDLALRVIQAENLWALMESIGICKWVGLAQDNFYDKLAIFYRLISENDKSREWMRGLGERCMNLIRTFNWREGWRPENSNLPKMFFEEDLVTPQQVYPALDTRSWQEGLEKYFSNWASIRESNPGIK